MGFDEFRTAIQAKITPQTIFFNPGGGTSQVVAVSDEQIRYRRGISTVTLRIRDIFDAYYFHRGDRMATTDLKEFRPSVYDSKARPSGHSCNCTFLLLLLQELGIVFEICGAGKKRDPFFVRIPK
ncbi:MAG: hypothetical protein HQM09_23995 [Candidatus Riflebacteria bacterium]|nr:hypothetical protein [Candidatus Riflebacteria bacterium]